MASRQAAGSILALAGRPIKIVVNNILSARGINLPKEALSSEKKLEEAVSLPFDEIVRIELRVIVDQIRILEPEHPCWPGSFWASFTGL